MHINTYLFHYFYHGLNAFDLLARGVGEHTRGFVGKYCHIAVALLDVDAPDVGGGETSFLAQKTDDVALAQLVFLALADIEREHLGGSGRRKEIGRRKGIDAHVALDKIGDMLLGTEHEEGVDYFFVTDEMFDSMIQKDDFLEYAKYVSHSYGTPRSYVEENLNLGKNVILEIEIQGALKVKKRFRPLPGILIFNT